MAKAAPAAMLAMKLKGTRQQAAPPICAAHRPTAIIANQ